MRTGGIVYFPWHRHQIVRRDQRLLLSHPKDTLASGVNGIAKVPKRKVFTEVGLKPSTVRSSVDPQRPNPLRATAPRLRLSLTPSAWTGGGPDAIRGTYSRQVLAKVVSSQIGRTRSQPIWWAILSSDHPLGGRY